MLCSLKVAPQEFSPSSFNVCIERGFISVSSRGGDRPCSKTTTITPLFEHVLVVALLSTMPEAIITQPMGGNSGKRKEKADVEGSAPPSSPQAESGDDYCGRDQEGSWSPVTEYEPTAAAIGIMLPPLRPYPLPTAVAIGAVCTGRSTWGGGATTARSTDGSKASKATGAISWYALPCSNAATSARPTLRPYGEIFGLLAW